MKETFDELYTRLFNENFSELEEKRKKESNKIAVILGIIAISFLMCIILAVINPAFIGTVEIFFAFIMVVVLLDAVILSATKKRREGQLSYRELFKEKVIKAIIENEFEDARYSPKDGLTATEYNKGCFKEHYDRYSSDDLVVASLKINDKKFTNFTFSEVHTEYEHTDEDGDSSYTTLFHGVAGYFDLPKSINTSLFVRLNGRVISWNKEKVKMDMSEFEKVFDVECNDKIYAMRILTPDIMADMIDLYREYKYKFEVSIINDTVYIRLATGSIFEPKVFEKTMSKKTIEKYYLVLKAITNIADHIYKTIDNLEV